MGVIELDKKGEIRFWSAGRLELSDGTKVDIPVVQLKGANAGPTLCLTSGTHGCELTGTGSIIKVTREIINLNELSGKILAVPMVNILAFQHSKHRAPQDDINLNRVFPGDANGSPSAQIAYAVYKEVVQEADYLIDFHTEPLESALPSCFTVAKREGIKEDVLKKSRELAKIFGFTLLETTASGTITEAAMRDGKPAFTSDLSGPWGTITRGGVISGVRGILNVMRHLRMIEGKIEQHPGIPVLDALKGPVEIRAKKGGIVLALCNGGEFVPKNTPVAKIYNLYGDVVEVVKSPTDGYIFGYPLLQNEAVATGEVVVSVLRK